MRLSLGLKSALVGLMLALLANGAIAETKVTVEDGIKAYQEERYADANRILLPFAKQEYPNAQQVLGNMYLGSMGVDASEDQAWRWHIKAVEGFKKYKYYREAESVLQPYLQANMFKAQIEQAKLILDAGSDEQKTNAIEFIKNNAEAGNAMAQYEMADIAYNWANSYDWAETYDEPLVHKVKWAKLSAEQGYGPAQFLYGKMLATNAHTHKIEGYPARDLKKRFEWMKLAADQGLMDAQASVAYAYRSARGVAESDVKFIEYLSQASDQGHLGARMSLAEAYRDGYRAEKDRAKALVLFKSIVDETSPFGHFSDTDQRRKFKAEEQVKALSAE